ncbi:MAG: hypothetical protein CVV42_16910 [Candidatus Riflebacteria bacterium HGW-Riflebacteria-2]|nr:MAG: hypothetical protein CVV42_16910 [Candidatus Riflebacteria bacterium HGW-Riflebacteria-2]
MRPLLYPLSYPEVSISLSNRHRHTLTQRAGTRADESTDALLIAIAVPVLLICLKPFWGQGFSRF